MKAQILYNIGNIKYSEKDKPVAGTDEALVRVLRCGICGSDIPRIYKTGAHNMPLVPGHEMMGVVEECASRPELVGKRAGIFPLIPCKKCSQCRTGHYEMCENYNYLGSRCDGGFGEYVVVPLWNLLPVPNEVTDDEAAMLEPMAVAVHAISRIGLLGESGGVDMQGVRAELETDGTALDHESRDAESDKGQNIAICGLGTIGLFVAMFLRDAGFRNVFCIGNKDIQREKLLKMGYAPEQFCDVRNTDPEEFIMDRTGGKRADYYFECIGRPESYVQAVSLTGPLGRIMLVGNPQGDMDLPREIYWKILRNQMTLTGTWNSSFAGIDGMAKTVEIPDGADSSFPQISGIDDWRYVVERLSAIHESGSCFADFVPSDLITHRFFLEDMGRGLEIMRDKSEEYIKVMVEI